MYFDSKAYLKKYYEDQWNSKTFIKQNQFYIRYEAQNSF